MSNFTIGILTCVWHPMGISLFVRTYCTRKNCLLGEIWLGGVLGHGTGFCLGGQRGWQASTVGGEGWGPEPQPEHHKAQSRCAGQAQGRQMWGKEREGTREGKLECLLRAISGCSFWGAIQLGHGRWTPHSMGEAPVQTCRDRGTGAAGAELFSTQLLPLTLQLYSKSKFQSFMSIKV